MMVIAGPSYRPNDNDRCNVHILKKISKVSYVAHRKTSVFLCIFVDTNVAWCKSDVA